MKRVIVEPHPDDAFLGLGWHLAKLWRGDNVTIVTVYCDRKRGEEAEEYARSVGAMPLLLGLEESRMDAKVQSKVIPELQAALTDLSWDRIYFPLGLQHPDHLSVAATRTPDARRYLDTPYQTKQKLSDSLMCRATGMIVESICWPSRTKWDKASIFKSQAKFFYYNSGLKDSLLPEIILCRPE